MERKIILASTSPKRKMLLAKAGLKFKVVPSDYEEDMTLPLPPDKLVGFLSKGKGESIAIKYKNAIIISADTIIYYKGKIFGKPHTNKKAFEMLSELSGHTHSAFTGFAIIDTKNKKIISKAVETKITFNELSIEMINEYIENGNPLKFAGAYTLRDVEERNFVKNVKGDWDNVIGLPVKVVMKELKKFGVIIS
ncbi:MAG: Maf family protein [bacterium]